MIVFFIRNYNDIDQLCPIIYKIRKDAHRDVVVLCLNPFYDIRDDFRLTFLRDRYHVVVKYVYKAYQPTPTHRIVSNVLSGNRYPPFFSKPVLNKCANLVAGIFENYLYYWVYERFFKDRVYDEKWAVGLLDKYKASILVFDFVKQKDYVVKAVVAAAGKMKIPTVAIPPGIMLFEEKSFPVKSFEKYHLPAHDYLIVHHEIRKKLTIKIGGPAEKITSLGSARFCREWESVLTKISPTLLPRRLYETGKLRLLYVDNKPVGEKWHESEVLEMLRVISSMDGVHMVIKPHTRHNRAYLVGLENCGEIVSDVHSIELFRWADVVVGMTSSILLEALCQNKILLSPKFVQKNKMLFEDMNACWQVHSLEELVEAVEAIKSKPGYRPYSNKDVERFMTQIVYNCDFKRDVLGEYMDFILGKEKNIWS